MGRFAARGHVPQGERFWLPGRRAGVLGRPLRSQQGGRTIPATRPRSAICLDRFDLQCQAISSHLVGQAVCDRIDARHQAILPPHVWGDGDPAGVNRRAAEDMKNAARAAQQFGVGVVNGFTGSSIWHLLYSFPPVPESMIDAGFEQFAERWNPILDVFGECGVQFALEVHPTEIAFDIVHGQAGARGARATARSSASTSTRAICCGRASIRSSSSARSPTASTTSTSRTRSSRSTAAPASWRSHLNFGDPRRGWDFRSPGRGGVNFEEIIRALNQAGYEGPALGRVGRRRHGPRARRPRGLRVRARSSTSSRAAWRSTRRLRRSEWRNYSGFPQEAFTGSCFGRTNSSNFFQ